MTHRHSRLAAIGLAQWICLSPGHRAIVTGLSTCNSICRDKIVSAIFARLVGSCVLLDNVTTCCCAQHKNHIDQSQQGCHPCWLCPWPWTHGLLSGYTATIEGVSRHGLQLVWKGSGITKSESPGKRKQIGVIAQTAAFCLLLGGFWPCRDSSTHSRYKLLWPRSMLSAYLLLIARRAPSVQVARRASTCKQGYSA